MQMINKKNLQKKLQNTKRIEQCALRFGITGDKTRLKICYLLCHHPELSVSQIAETVSAPISTVSHSLKRLKKAGVVANRRKAKNVFYSLEDNSFVSFLKDQLLT